jgi:hypothetical protein
MSQTFTQDDVLRYIYKETSTEETKEIKQALLIDEHLMDVYHQMSALVLQLDQAMLEPSESCVQNILNHAKSFDFYSV